MTMDQLIADFSKQLEEAVLIGEGVKLKVDSSRIQNIVVSGLGGSGIGGNLVAELVSDQLKVPYSVNKGYFLPAFVGENTLVIVSSYSGNTEETTSAMSQAIERGAQIICVTSGGKVQQTAMENSIDCITIPGGMPPRACLGYSFVQQLYILKELGLTDDSVIQGVKKSIISLRENKQELNGWAADLARQLHNKILVIYSADECEAVAVRFRQQINENSKMLCWHHVLPEMNHNELVGWRKKNDDLAVLFLKNPTDYDRTKMRFDITREVVSKYTPNIFEFNSIGSSKVERALYLIHLGDWLSFWMAKMNEMDAVEVKVIDYLKGELAKS